MNRERAVDRLKGLLLRARSANENEAALARSLAAEWAAEYNLDVEETLRQIALDEGPSWRRSAVEVDPNSSWRARLASSLASRRGCQALDAEGRLHFDGSGAGEALSDYRRLVGEVERADARYFETHGLGGRNEGRFRALWSAIFPAEAVAAYLDPGARPRGVRIPEGLIRELQIYGLGGSVHHLVESAVRDGRKFGLELAGVPVSEQSRSAEPPSPRMEPDAFALRDGLILVTSRKPGNFATLFLAEGSLSFRMDASSFDDQARKYTWAFERGNVFGKIVFATADRAVVGDLDESGARVTEESAWVARTREGAPMHVEKIE